MTTAHKQTELSWRRKYYTTLQELDDQEQRWKQKERLLRLMVSRLTLAADQSDKELTKQLEKLRGVVRSDTDTAKLRSFFDSISDRIVRLDSHAKKPPPEHCAALVLTQLLDQLPIPAEMNAKVHKLRKRLSSLSDRALEPIIEELAALIISLGDHKGSEPNQAPAMQTGVFNKLLGARANSPRPERGTDVDVEPDTTTTSIGTTEGSFPPLHQVLVQLVEQLEFPTELSAKRDTLIEGFAAAISEDKVASAVKAIADLVKQAHRKIQQEKQAIEQLLLQLTGQLHELDEYLAERKALSQEVLQHREEFDARLDNHVEEIETSANEATDLNQLRSSLRTKLGTIREHLEEDRRLESERNRIAQDEIDKLTSKLQTMEQNMDSLNTRFEKERKLAQHDALTGLFNRLSYDKRIVEDLTHWKRYKRPLSMAIFDIDNFKNINDTFGHKAGDKVLKLIAEILRSKVRETDFLARYGGEEFVVIMRETEHENARIAVEKLRRTVAEYTFHYQGKPVTVTVSGGFTSFQEGDTQGLAFERADNALYRAKAAGKNRCYSDIPLGEAENDVPVKVATK